MTSMYELRKELEYWADLNGVDVDSYQFRADDDNGIKLVWKSNTPKPSIETLEALDRKLVKKFTKHKGFEMVRIEMVDSIDEIPIKAQVKGSLCVVNDVLKFWNGTEWR